MDRDDVAKVLGERLGQQRTVVAAWLFGSFSRGRARPSSDVDVCVLFAGAPSSDEVLDLQTDLAGALGRDVDLVPARDAPADLIHRVLRDGVLLVDRDRSARIAFEVEMRGRYFDMTPVWLEYRAARTAS